MLFDTSIFEKALIPVPSDPTLWAAFTDALRRWRVQKLAELQYDPGLYERDDLQWMAKSFTLAHVMMNDEEFFCPSTNEYRVDEYLDRALRDFGGFDCVLLWHAYPRIGVDDRNQFDFYRQSPGGIKRLAALIERLHFRNVKVFLDYNPWDTGTRRDPEDDLSAIVTLIREIQADGVFLDTMEAGAASFREMLDATRLGVVLEPEGMTPMEGIQHQHASYGQGFDYCWPNVHGRPIRTGILRNKWLEPRHMVHQTFRWALDHTDEIHTAWLNGSGLMVWENVFGSWFNWNEYDKSRWRSISPVLRRYVDVFTSQNWDPLVPCLSEGLGASKWSSGSLQIWTLANRGEYDIDGAWFEVETAASTRWFDLISGQELNLSEIPGGRMAVISSIRRGDVAAILAVPGSLVDEDLVAFVSSQSDLFARWNRDTAHHILDSHRLVPPDVAAREHPENFALVAAHHGTQTINFRRRECGDYDRVFSTQIDNPWTNGLHHMFSVEREISINAFGIEPLEVSNADFKEFIDATDYQPTISENFLHHWIDGAPQPGHEDYPVVWVDLADARAYAAWKSARLPDEHEWQLAAEQGLIQRRSPLVWNWTESVHTDGHTRFCILKGGADYRAEGSEWYTDGGPREHDFSLKFQLWWPGLDRCATVGFRCAASLAFSD